MREWTRELRAAGLLLVRDRRGDSRKPGVSTVSASTYIPVVVRGHGRRAGSGTSSQYCDDCPATCRSPRRGPSTGSTRRPT
ncbi:hypothetical protein ACFQ3Z_15755 [Streptomyces nogalater]